MDLRSHLAKPGKSAAALARTVGVAHSTVLRWADGTMAVDERRIPAIIQATDGEVTAAELRPDLAALFSAAPPPPSLMPDPDAADGHPLAAARAITFASIAGLAFWCGIGAAAGTVAVVLGWVC